LLGLNHSAPHVLDALLDPAEFRGRRVRLMFQDEARFGRMVRIRRCWAQKPMRPTVCNGYERQFVYVYGAVSPMQGQLDWDRRRDEYHWRLLDLKFARILTACSMRDNVYYVNYQRHGSRRIAWQCPPMPGAR
jgi:hypothetical protein